MVYPLTLEKSPPFGVLHSAPNSWLPLAITSSSTYSWAVRRRMVRATGVHVGTSLDPHGIGNAQ